MQYFWIPDLYVTLRNETLINYLSILSIWFTILKWKINGHYKFSRNLPTRDSKSGRVVYLKLLRQKSYDIRFRKVTYLKASYAIRFLRFDSLEFKKYMLILPGKLHMFQVSDFQFRAVDNLLYCYKLALRLLNLGIK